MCYNETVTVGNGVKKINRFFVNEEFDGNKVTLLGEEVHHIRNVLKMKEKEKLILIKNSKEYVFSIDKIEKNSIILSMEDEISEKKENDFSVTLFQGLPKGDKADFIVEKAVEAGADEIVLLNTKRSVALFKKENLEKKEERFSKIAKSAACQSGRLKIPVVRCALKLEELDFSDFDLLILCYEDEKKTTLKQVLKSNSKKEKIGIFIGPEGGIDESEVEILSNKGFLCASLGKRILRCETAGLYALAQLNYEIND